MRRHLALEKVVVPVIEAQGFKFAGLQLQPQGRGSLLRLFIDKPGGVTIEDCERASRQVNAVLGVEQPIQGDYTLEVSSPGLDRLLFTKEQFEEQLGKVITIRLIVPIQGKRNWKGRLQSVQDDALFMIVDEEEITLSFKDMVEARVVPSRD